MKKLSFFPLAILTAVILTGCSVTLKGVITDVVTDQPVKDAKASISIEGKDEPRLSKPTGEDGKYRIKKDDEIQDVVYSAENYEDFTVSLEKVKAKDVYLVPTPEETARRIVQAMLDKDYDTAYQYLHPNYQGIFTKEKFREENQGDFENFLSTMEGFRIAETQDQEKYQDAILSKTYRNVKSVTVLLTMDEETEQEVTWVINLVKMSDQNNKEFWHWIFDRTSNT